MSALREIYGFTLFPTRRAAGSTALRGLCEHGYAKGANGCLVAEPTSMATIEIGQKGNAADNPGPWQGGPRKSWEL